ncbi:MAG: hypothetical protein DI531_08225 [Brevundimonas sp.]|uniref:gp53-like domain-containing protein n=1 Tax=Brevundimonas sp. TaxID=1871086 RepID=UPI000DB12656|nr:hypothetical protein [Brevundimonas sp.]PZU74149.1 MAG: hypothetical protein DI531_08225 [Brevundimonas sp.]
MAGLKITITDAGRAALPNGPNTGTSAVVISHVGISNVHTPGSLKGLTTLPGEIKRVTTFGGDVVADDVIHVTINDETADVYSVRAFGLYLSTGVLFAVFSAADVIVEKSAGAMVLLSADITLVTIDTAAIQFGGTGFINPPATTERLGVVELATWEEAAAGARADAAVTPFGLLKTLQSWALNFAAAVHGHAMTNIDGLPEALAGKASASHSHAAGDVTSGVFDVGRIPALAMEKITGLATALAGKAAAVHGHVMADIDGLVQALSGKSAVGHKHDASDTTTGVFDVGRIPALAMEKITGLAAALALKATLGADANFADIRAARGNGTGVIFLGDVAHYLFFDGLNYNLPAAPLIVNGGVVWTTASFDPTTKADAANPTFTGPMRHKGAALEMPGTGSFFSLNLYYDGGWRRRSADHGWAVRHSGGVFDVLYGPTGPAGQLVGEQNLFRLDGEQRRLVVADGIVWTTQTFNPATKADLASPDFTDNVRLPATTLFKKEVAGTSEGGQFFLQRPDTATTLAQDVVVDLNGDSLRIWERAGAFRGVSLNLAAQDANVGSVIHTTATLKPSTQAEAAAGVATDRFITPAALWSFARDLGPVGRAVIPGTGLMIQWGVSTANTTEGQVHATLPVAFGGGCLVALANPRNPTSNINSDYYMQVVSRHLDRIVFFANRANGSAGNLDGYEWLALGRVSGTPDPAYGGGGSGGGGDPGGDPGGGGGGGGQVEV